MSFNTALNATIALIENRPEQFKEMLRAPASDVKDLPAVRARLDKALNFYAATKIRVGLMDSLHLTPPESLHVDNRSDIPECADLQSEAYYAGVRAAEKIFETLIAALEGK